MATIQQIQAAVKAAPHYRVTCGALEVIGEPGATRWTFGYIVRRPVDGGKVRTSYGKRNAVEYLATLASDTPIENVTFRASRGMVEQAAIYAACVAHVEKRKAMIAANRERAAMLRNRAWSERALDSLAFHAFALAGDKDGNRSVELAVVVFSSQHSRDLRAASAAYGPRDAWRDAFRYFRVRA